MSTRPVIEIPTDLLNRWRELQRLRSGGTVGRCDCQCRRCTIDSARQRGSEPAS